MEKTIDTMWQSIDKIREAFQKQAIQIAFIVGGVSAIINIVSLAVYYYAGKSHP